MAGFQLRQCEIGVGLAIRAMPNRLPIEGRRMQRPSRHQAMARLVLILALVYGAIVLLNPWAIHIGGGRWTPLLIWNGTGKLVTASGVYPLMVTINLSPHGSQTASGWAACYRRPQRLGVAMHSPGHDSAPPRERDDLWRLAQHRWCAAGISPA